MIRETTTLQALAQHPKVIGVILDTRGVFPIKSAAENAPEMIYVLVYKA